MSERDDWRVWCCFMFTDNSRETQALPDDKLRELICRNIDIRERFEEGRIMRAALNAIASWGEGDTVDSSFDEPGSAQMAREALTAVGSGNPAAPLHSDATRRSAAQE